MKLLEMKVAIAEANGVDESFITDVSSDGMDVDFRMNGVWFYGKFKSGKFNIDSMRRCNI